jgi:LPS-assembly protein
MPVLCVHMDFAIFRPPPRVPISFPVFCLIVCFSRPGLLAAAQKLPNPTGSEEARQIVSIKADSQEKEKDTYHLRGHVEVTYRGMKLNADQADYNESTAEVVAKGHVLFTDPQSRLAAEEVHYNVKTGKGWFVNAQGFVHARVRQRARVLMTLNPFYMRAQRVDRLDEDSYTLENGHLTSCECETRGWSLSAGSARIAVGDKVETHDAVFRLLRVPLFYSPFLVNSIARRPRQSGFLLPHVGNSTQKGFIIGDGFFWDINPSADLQLGVEDYTARGLAGRAEFRARPSTTSQVLIDWYGVRDRGGGPQGLSKAPGQSLRAVASSNDLGYGFRGVVDVDYITSLAFRLTYSDSFTQAVTSETHQNAFLAKNFDAYSLDFYASRYQNFFTAQNVSANSVVIRETPGASFSGMDKEVGHTPFYFSFDASASGVGRTEPGLVVSQLSERLDFHPEVTLRSKSFWGFHLTPRVGFRATHYGTSLEANHDPLTRLLGEFTLDLRPPSLEKVFSGSFAHRRFKHVVEPDITYRLVRVRDAQNILDVVRYDDVDILAETNEVEYSLANSILARKDVPDDSPDKPPARELISLRLSQKYYFDPTFGGALVPGGRFVFDPTISLTGFAFAQGQRLSPVVSVLKFAPFSNYDTELRADLNPNGGGVLNAGITSHIRRGRAGLAFTDFFINRTAVLNTSVIPPVPASQLPSFHLLRTVATYGDANRKGFSGAFGLDYNFAQQIAHQVVGQVSYNFGCFALDLEYRRFALGTLRRENVFRVALSLANVGTFGNLKPRERLY